MTSPYYPKIYCWIHSGRSPNLVGMAMAEDGAALVTHISSSREWAQHDLGYNSTWHHEVYKSHYPKGYTLIWVDHPEVHRGVLTALERNKSRLLPIAPLPGVVNVWDLI